MDSTESLSKEQQQEPVSQLAKELAILLRPQIEGLATAVNNFSDAIRMIAAGQNLTIAPAQPLETSPPETNLDASAPTTSVGSAPVGAEPSERLASEEEHLAISPPPPAAADDDDLIEESDVVLDNVEDEPPTPEPEVTADVAPPTASETASDTSSTGTADRSAKLIDTPYFSDKLRRYVAAFEAKYELAEPATRKRLGRALEATGMNSASAQVAISVLIKSQTLFQKGDGDVLFNSTAVNLAKAIDQEPEIFFKEEMDAERVKRSLVTQVTEGGEAASDPKPSSVTKDWRLATGEFVRRVLEDRGDEIEDIMPNVNAPSLQRKETWRRILRGDGMLSPSVYKTVLDELCRVYELEASRGDDFYAEAQQLIAKFE